MPDRLTLLDIPESDGRELLRAINDRLRLIERAVNDVDAGGGVSTIIRERTTTTAAGGNQVIIYKLLSENITLPLPGPEVPNGSVVLYILRQPIGAAWGIAWATGFYGTPGDAPRRPNSYSVFRWYKVSNSELLLLDYPVRGEQILP